MAPRSERERGRRFSSTCRAHEDRSFTKNAQRRGMKENDVGTNSQQPPEQVPDDAKAPARVQREQAVTATEGERRNVGTTEGNTLPASFLRFQHLELTLLKFDREIQLVAVD